MSAGGGGRNSELGPPRAKRLKDPNIRTNTPPPVRVLLIVFLFVQSECTEHKEPHTRMHEKFAELHAELRGKATDYRTLSLLLVKLSDESQRKDSREIRADETQRTVCANKLTEHFFGFPSRQQRSSLVFYGVGQRQQTQEEEGVGGRGCRQTRERCRRGRLPNRETLVPNSRGFTSLAGRLIE